MLPLWWGHLPSPCSVLSPRPGRVVAILQARAAKANVRAFSPPDLRRSCVSDVLDAGVDISAVQRFVGHDNVTTTAQAK